MREKRELGLGHAMVVLRDSRVRRMNLGFGHFDAHGKTTSPQPPDLGSASVVRCIGQPEMVKCGLEECQQIAMKASNHGVRGVNRRSG